MKLIETGVADTIRSLFTSYVLWLCSFCHIVGRNVWLLQRPNAVYSISELWTFWCQLKINQKYYHSGGEVATSMGHGNVRTSEQSAIDWHRFFRACVLRSFARHNALRSKTTVPILWSTHCMRAFNKITDLIKMNAIRRGAIGVDNNNHKTRAYVCAACRMVHGERSEVDIISCLRRIGSTVSSDDLIFMI